MSIEFVEPEETAATAPPAPVVRPSALPGRLLAGTTGLAAVLVGIAVLAPFHAVERTAFVIDFDGTSTQDARVVYDAFGHADTVPLAVGTGGLGGGSAYSSVLSVSLTDGISYAPWWLGVGAALVVLAGWALVRPRSNRAGALVAALGGILLGSVGAAWLQIRTVSADSVPQIRFAAHPDLGLWLLVAAGGLALLAGVLHATRPPVRRLLPRRRAV